MGMFPNSSRKSVPPSAAPHDKPFDEAVGELERSLLRNALERARFNQRKAAQLLGLTYHQFRGVYRKHRKGLA